MALIPFPNDIWREICQYPGNEKCCDCASLDTDWGNVNHGTLLCLECAGKHRSLGVKISFIRSIHMDTWSRNQIEMMRNGGNGRIQAYFKKLKIDSLPLLLLYTTDGASFYREDLKDIVNKRMSSGASMLSPRQSPSHKYLHGGSATPVEFFSLLFGEGSIGLTVVKDPDGSAVVSRILPGGPADLRGILIDDRIAGVAGKGASNYEEALKLLSSSGRPVKVTFSRLHAVVSTAAPKTVTDAVQLAPLGGIGIAGILNTRKTKRASPSASPRLNSSKVVAPDGSSLYASPRTPRDDEIVDSAAGEVNESNNVACTVSVVDIGKGTSLIKLGATHKLAEESNYSSSSVVSSLNAVDNNICDIMPSNFDAFVLESANASGYDWTEDSMGSSNTHVDESINSSKLESNADVDVRCEGSVSETLSLDRVNECNFQEALQIEETGEDGSSGSDDDGSITENTDSLQPTYPPHRLEDDMYSGKFFRVRIEHPPLGLTLIPNPSSAACVLQVMEGKAAHSVGVRRGDILVGIEDKWISHFAEATEILAATTYPVSLVFRRPMSVYVTRLLGGI